LFGVGGPVHFNAFANAGGGRPQEGWKWTLNAQDNRVCRKAERKGSKSRLVLARRLNTGGRGTEDKEGERKRGSLEPVLGAHLRQSCLTVKERGREGYPPPKGCTGGRSNFCGRKF